jgi:hypothetical protein
MKNGEDGDRAIANGSDCDIRLNSSSIGSSKALFSVAQRMQIQVPEYHLGFLGGLSFCE